MKTALTALVAFIAIGSLGTSSIGCSSPSEKEEVDTDSALSQLRTPTGSFSDQTAGAAFGNYRSTRADSQRVSAPGGATGDGTRTQSIRLLDKAATSGACRQGESCACPGGGALTYTAGTNDDGALVKVTFDACRFEDGYGFDGKAILLVSKKSLLGIAQENATAPKAPPTKADTSDGDSSESGGLQEAPSTDVSTSYGAASVLLAAKGTASYGSKSLKLEFALISEAHYAFLAVKVPDGNIVIGVSDSGDAIVRSKEGTWKCHSAKSGWKCTSDKGQSMDVVEQAPSKDDSVAPVEPPSSSASPPSTDTDSSDLDG